MEEREGGKASSTDCPPTHAPPPTQSLMQLGGALAAPGVLASDGEGSNDAEAQRTASASRPGRAANLALKPSRCGTKPRCRSCGLGNRACGPAPVV